MNISKTELSFIVARSITEYLDYAKLPPADDRMLGFFVIGYLMRCADDKAIKELRAVIKDKP